MFYVRQCSYGWEMLISEFLDIQEKTEERAKSQGWGSWATWVKKRWGNPQDSSCPPGKVRVIPHGVQDPLQATRAGTVGDLVWLEHLSCRIWTAGREWWTVKLESKLEADCVFIHVRIPFMCTVWEMFTWCYIPPHKDEYNLKHVNWYI